MWIYQTRKDYIYKSNLETIVQYSHSWIWGVIIIMCTSFGHPVYFTLWSPNIYFHKLIDTYLSLQCVWNMNPVWWYSKDCQFFTFFVKNTEGNWLIRLHKILKYVVYVWGCVWFSFAFFFIVFVCLFVCLLACLFVFVLLKGSFFKCHS